MRKAILIMLLAAMSNSTMAEWVEFSGNDKYTVYINPNIVWEEGEIANMWHLFDYKAVQESDCHISYISSIMLYKYDCNNEKFQSIYLSAHSEHMGQGEVSVVPSNRYPEKWDSVSPNSFGEKLSKMACRKRGTLAYNYQPVRVVGVFVPK